MKLKNKTFLQFSKNGEKITDFETGNKKAVELPEMMQHSKKK